MPTMLKTLSCALLSTLFLYSSLACADPVKIRVGHGSAAEEPLWMVKAAPDVTPHQGKSYIADYTLFRSTDKRFQAFEAGELDIMDGSAHSVMMAAAQGLEFKVVASLSHEGGANGFATQYMVKDDSPIHSFADLKGKKIGINGPRSSIDIWARLALTKHGLDPARDVKWVALPFSSQGEAVRAGTLDVGAFPQPFAAFEQERGGLRTVFTSLEGIGQQEDLMLLLVKKDFAEKHPQVLRDFLSDLVAATHYYVEHPEQSHQKLIDAKFVNVPLELSLKMRDYEHAMDARVDVESLQKMVKALREFGYIEKDPDLKSVVDMSYLPQ